MATAYKLCSSRARRVRQTCMTYLHVQASKPTTCCRVEIKIYHKKLIICKNTVAAYGACFVPDVSLNFNSKIESGNLQTYDEEPDVDFCV